MATAGSIVVSLLMNTGQFETDTKRAESIAKKRADAIDKAFAEMGRKIGLAATAAGGAIAAMVVSTANAAKEISNLANLSGAGTEEFQRFAAGAKSVGIEQDKLGDIFKDFREKVGEFVQTGGGGMKDFFEQIAPKVGITADAFRNLSGPQALQLYVDTLEKAGLSQEQMSFYLESMASDTTALIPLLRDGGKEMTALGDAASKTGQIMDNETIKSSVELKKQMDEFQGIMRGITNQIAAAVIPGLSSMAGEFLKVARDVGVAQASIITFGGVVARALKMDEIGKAQREIGAVTARIDFLNKRMEATSKLPWGGLMQPGIRKELEEQLALRAKLNEQLKGTVAPPAPTADMYGPALPTGFVNTQSAPWVPPTKPTKAPKAPNAQKSEAERAYESIQKQIAALNEQAATFGMTEKAATLYALKTEGATEAQLKQAGATLDQIEMLQFLEEEMKRAADAKDRLNQMLDATPTMQIKQMSDDVDLLRQAFESGAIKDAQVYIEAVQMALGTLPDKAKEAGDAMSEFSKSAAQNMQSAFADFLFDPFKDGLGGMLKGFGQTIQRMIAEAASAQLMRSLFGDMGKTGSIGGWAGQALGLAGALFGGSSGAAASGAVGAAAGASSYAASASELTKSAFSFGGFRASGGSVATGHAYMVGERGPEMFVPSSAGAILPTGTQPGGQRSEYNINVTVPAGSSQETRRAAAAGAREALGFINQAGRYA